MQFFHTALWTNDPEKERDFYVTYFGGKSGEKYVNPKKGFASYFVTFENGVALEIMQRQDISASSPFLHTGLAHLAFRVDSADEVRRKTEQFRSAGYVVAGEPRLTGDGYYEAAILDPDGNLVEIVAEGATPDSITK